MWKWCKHYFYHIIKTRKEVQNIKFLWKFYEEVEDLSWTLVCLVYFYFVILFLLSISFFFFVFSKIFKLWTGDGVVRTVHIDTDRWSRQSTVRFRLSNGWTVEITHSTVQSKPLIVEINGPDVHNTIPENFFNEWLHNLFFYEGVRKEFKMRLT